IDAVSSALSTIINWGAKAVEALQPLLNILNGINRFSGVTAVFQIISLTGGESNTSGVSVDPNAVSLNNPDQGNFSNSGEAYLPGTQEGKNKFALESNKNKGSKGGSGNERQKEIDLAKEEKSILDEIIDRRSDELALVEKMVTLGQATMAQRNELLQSFLSELESQKSVLKFSDNIMEAENKVADLKLKQKQTLDEILKQEQESYKNIIEKAGKETESVKDYLKNNTEAEQKLKGLKLTNEGDEKALALFNIDEKYRKEIANINSLRIAEETKVKIIKELEIRKAADIEKIETEGQLRQL
ncbi:MAG TPA: hypothetical protein PKA39_12580, partial [Ignavibacteria bacterium]|nr:hypothetical protein [Ignavibacteria bacterium]